jgi:hypothetical protein
MTGKALQVEYCGECFQRFEAMAAMTVENALCHHIEVEPCAHYTASADQWRLPPALHPRHDCRRPKRHKRGGRASSHGGLSRSERDRLVRLEVVCLHTLTCLHENRSHLRRRFGGAELTMVTTHRRSRAEDSHGASAEQGSDSPLTMR